MLTREEVIGYCLTFPYAYHMNKTHWISVILDDSVPEAEIMGMIADSFSLCAKK